VFDHNGWLHCEQLAASQPAEGHGGAGSIFNHNVYLQGSAGDSDARTNTDVTLRGNILSRAASHGLQHRSGGMVRNNLFARNAIGMFNRGDTLANVVIQSMDRPYGPRGFGLQVFAPVRDSRVIGNYLVDRLGSIDRAGLVVTGDEVPESWAVQSDRDRGPTTVVTGNFIHDWASSEGRSLKIKAGSDWAVVTGNATHAEASFTDAFDDYMSADGDGWSRFIAGARRREHGEWPARYTARAFNRWLRRHVSPASD
jgi:hypothetical protein